MSRPVFIVRRGDRLAARLKSLLLAWRFSNEVGGQLVFCWFPRDRSIYGALPPEPYGASLIWNLPRFYAERGFEDLIFLDGEYRRNDPYPSLTGPDYAAYRPDQFKRELFQGRALTFLESNHLDYRFADDTNEVVLDQMRHLLARLPLEPRVAEVLERARGELGDQPFVALHVRRGDVLSLMRLAIPEMQSGTTSDIVLRYTRATAGYTAPLDWYDPFVADALDRGEKVVFFSDTPETFEHFERIHGRRKLVKAATLTRGMKIPIQQAFVEFQLMMKASRVIGTRSSFAGFAARLAGVPVTNVQAGGSPQGLERYFFDEVLQAAVLPADVSERLRQALGGA